MVNDVYALTHKGSFKRDFGLRDQIQRAAVSCMSNVAEGFDSDTTQQFVQMLSYTRRSASEVQSELYVALDRDYIGKEEFSRCYGQAQAVRKLANGFIRYLRTREPVNPSTRTPANRPAKKVLR